MQDTQWFYADAQQQQQGPVSFQQIQMLAAGGQIQSSTLIWHDGMANWTAAGQVDGVFNAPAQAVVPPASGGGANPYAPPAVGMPGGGMATAGGSYPIPVLKRCSFGKFLAFFLIGIVIFGVAIAIITSSTSTRVSSYQRLDRNWETAEDLEQFNREVERINSQAVSGPSGSEIGALLAMGAGVIFLMVAYIMALIVLHRAWALLQPGGARTTPGKAVGFLFIPLFNIYWMFVAYYGWSQDWNRIRTSHSNLANLPSASEGLFLTFCICAVVGIIPLLGIIASLVNLILLFVMTAKLCAVVNASQDARNASGQGAAPGNASLPNMY